MLLHQRRKFGTKAARAGSFVHGIWPNRSQWLYDNHLPSAGYNRPDRCCLVLANYCHCRE